MKLNGINEAGMTRRDFVKKGAAAAVGASPLGKLLLAKGVAPETARQFLGQHAYVEMPLGHGDDFGTPAEDLFSDTYAAFQRLLKLGTGKIKAAGLYDESDGPSECFAGLVKASPDAIAGLMERADYIEEADNGSIMIEVDDDQYFISPNQPSIWESIPITKNIAKAWWEGWGEYAVSPVSDGFVDMMRANGVDVTKRTGELAGHFADMIADDPARWGDPRKYGITWEDVANSKEATQQWRDSVRGPNSRAEGDPVEYMPDGSHDDRHANPMHQSFESLQRRLTAIFEGKKDKDDPEYKAAVAVVQYRDKWLLGLSLSTDDRRLKWCMPGGGVKGTETPEKAAERECKEETGVTCRAVGKAFTLPGKPNVAFVHCKADYIKRIEPNSEFAALAFFKREEMKSLTLYKNVLNLIDRCK